MQEWRLQKRLKVLADRYGAVQSSPSTATTTTETALRDAPQCMQDDDLQKEEVHEVSDVVAGDSEGEPGSPPITPVNVTVAESDEEKNLAVDLAYWAVNRRVGQRTLTELLKLLTFHDIPAVPLCARTLLKTPRDIRLKEIGNGHYYHFGIEASIRYVCMRDNLADLPPNCEMALNINVDGLPAGKSSNSQLWPILGQVSFPYTSEEVEESEISTYKSLVFMIGVFYGEHSKPACVSEYLEDFIEEYRRCTNEGVLVFDKQERVTLYLKTVICDAPARAFVKCTQLHNGHYGCDKCEEKGVWMSHRMTFSKLDAPLRTDESFRNKSQAQHHKPGKPPFLETNLADTGIGMVSQVTSEYLHALLGVVKKTLSFWAGSRNRQKVRQRTLRAMSRTLESLSATCPSELARKPRALKYLPKFKATELRSFLCYTFVLVARNRLPVLVYNHFKKLVCASRILISPGLCAQYVDYAGELLVAFVKAYGRLYGKKHVVYNVHSLIHVAADAKIHGSLDQFSAFPFESHLNEVKQMIKKPSCTLKQIVHRVYERRSLVLPKSRVRTSTKYIRRHKAGPLPKQYRTKVVEQYTSVRVGETRYSTAGGDKCVYVQGHGVGVIVNLLRETNDTPVAVLQYYTSQTSVFDDPFPSAHIGIHQVDNLSSAIEHVPLSLCSKVWLMPSDDITIAAELMHENL